MSSAKHVRKEVDAVYCLHQEAAMLFETGRVEAARKASTNAFSAMNRMLRQIKRPHVFYFPGSPLVRCNQVSPEFSETLDMQTFQLSFQVDSTKCKSTTGPMNNMASRTLSDLPIHYRLLKLPEFSTVNQFAFVTLYNLALSTHLSAILHESSSTTTQDDVDHKKSNIPDMQSAAKLWELVYSFQWCRALNLKPIHALAVLVNLGHAQCYVGNNEGSKKCYENILSAIQILEGRNQSIPHRSFFVYSAFRMLSENNSRTFASAA